MPRMREPLGPSRAAAALAATGTRIPKPETLAPHRPGHRQRHFVLTAFGDHLDCRDRPGRRRERDRHGRIAEQAPYVAVAEAARAPNLDFPDGPRPRPFARWAGCHRTEDHIQALHEPVDGGPQLLQLPLRLLESP